MPTAGDPPDFDEPSKRTWIKSSRSNGNGCCVEVSFGPTPESPVLVRDSKFPRQDSTAGDEPLLALDRESWNTFLEVVATSNHGEGAAPLQVTPQPDSSVKLRSNDGVELLFTAPEWDAFVGGVADGELR